MEADGIDENLGNIMTASRLNLIDVVSRGEERDDDDEEPCSVESEAEVEAQRAASAAKAKYTSDDRIIKSMREDGAGLM